MNLVSGGTAGGSGDEIIATGTRNTGSSNDGGTGFNPSPEGMIIGSASDGLTSGGGGNGGVYFNGEMYPSENEANIARQRLNNLRNQYGNQDDPIPPVKNPIPTVQPISGVQGSPGGVTVGNIGNTTVQVSASGIPPNRGSVTVTIPYQ